MTPERRRKIEELYRAAQARVPKERSAFLDEACQGDDELRRQVETLLAQNEAGAPKLLFDHAGELYEVTADGQRFIVLTPLEQAQFHSPITVILNWQAELKR
jgi:hypothetical protein